MKENLKIAVLRSTIFIPQGVLYTPENATRFRADLFPNATVYGVPQPGIPFVGVNPNMPQYGMPWRLSFPNGIQEYNVVFLPNKIDIMLSTLQPYDSNVEREFINESIRCFNSILELLPANSVQRIAYAPLFAIMEESGVDFKPIWGTILKNTERDGLNFQDINLSYLIKKSVTIGNLNLQLNLLHNIFDGFQTRVVNNEQQMQKALLFQLDINSVPETILSLTKEDVSVFFEGVLSIKSDLINGIIS